MKNSKSVLVALLATILMGPLFAKGSSGHSGSHSSAGTGSHSISGHTTKKGTYVAPSHATNPNGTKSDNWSHKGNVNPYTGKQGTKD